MKRLLNILVIALVVSMLLSSIVSADNTLKQSDNRSGVILSVDDFNQTMVGAEEQRKSLRSHNSYNSVDLELRDISFVDDNITFDANISGKTFTITGPLYQSYKAQNGMNSVVGDLKDQTNSFKILLFEIFNDSKDDNLLLNKHLNQRPHLKMYLLDSNKNIHIYEMDIPKELSRVNADSFKEWKDSKKEMFWFIGLAKPELITEIPTEGIDQARGFSVDNFTTMGLNSWSTWTNPTTYYAQFYVGSDLTECWSLPYLTYRHVNVTPQDSTWAANFKIAEHTKVGSYTYHGNNVFEYKNLKIAFGTGDNTTILRTLQDGRVYDTSIFGGLKKAGDDIAVDTFKKILSTVPYGSTVADVLGYINTAISSSEDVELGATGVNLKDDIASAAGEKLKSKYKLEANTEDSNGNKVGHYFNFQIVNSYEGNGSSSSTTGVLELNFDVFNYVDYSTTPVSKPFNLYYTASSS